MDFWGVCINIFNIIMFEQSISIKCGIEPEPNKSINLKFKFKNAKCFWMNVPHLKMPNSKTFEDVSWLYDTDCRLQYVTWKKTLSVLDRYSTGFYHIWKKEMTVCFWVTRNETKLHVEFHKALVWVLLCFSFCFWYRKQNGNVLAERKQHFFFKNVLVG